MTTSTALFLGLLLGIRHAMDTDHIVAMSTFISRGGGLPRAIFFGLIWGIGHIVTILIVGFVVLVLKLTIPATLALTMEITVGILLVVLGAPLVWQFIKSRPHLHMHQHENASHLHFHAHHDSPNHIHAHLRRPFLVGMIHGLAGSGALTILVLNTTSSLKEGMGFLLLFGIGSIFSMLVFSGLISLPLQLTKKLSFQINHWIQATAGLVSTILGLFIIWQVIFNSGYFI